MFIKRTKSDELTTFVNELLSEETPDFRRRLVTALARLKPEQWDALEAVALELMKAPASSASHTPAFEEEARAKAELYYHQLLSEEEPDRQASSAKERGAG